MASTHFIPAPASTADYRLADSTADSSLSPHDPAIEAMTDLRASRGLTLNNSVQIDHASSLMAELGVHFLPVTDEERRLLGILSLTDVLSEKPMQLVHERGLRHSEILVGDLRIATDDLYVMELQDVTRMSAGRVFETLKAAGRQYAIVVQQAGNGQRRVSGIFSAADLARRLGADYPALPVNRSFAEIEAALAA
jgi:CBS domain-containing protein